MAGAALAVAAWCAGSLVPAPSVGAATAPCPAAPVGRISVTVVIDDGSSVRLRCVEVAERATGGEALLAVATVRRDDPVKGPAFVCGIDGVPAVGCAAVGEPYWSYWSGGAGWTYQAIGAFGYRLPVRCAVEGWRFGTGRTAPAIPVPSTPCTAPPATAVPPTVPPVTSPAAPGVAPSAAGGGASGAVGAAPGGVATVPGVAPPTVAGASTVAPSPPGPAPGPSGAAPPGAAGSSGSGSAPAGGSGPTGSVSEEAATPAAVGTGATDPDTEVPSEGRDEAASASATRGRSGDGGPGWTIVLGFVAIVGLGGAAWVRARRDRVSSPVA